MLNLKKKKKLNQSSFKGLSKTRFSQDYEIIKEISISDFSTVYLGIHKLTNINRCIKVINLKHFTQEENLSNLEEIKILKKMDHPYIINLIEYFEEEDLLILVLEYLDGGDLYHKIEEMDKFSEKDALKIVKKILIAINFLHKKNIIHRDLKLDNIVFDQQTKNLKIVDFGTSKILSQNEILKSKKGTLYYMAPEVFDCNYGLKCDIWSCGVILYILLCGYPPFNHPDENEIINSIKSGEIDYFEEDWELISENTKKLVQTMLVVNPEKRLNVEEILKFECFKNTEKKQLNLKEQNNYLINMKNLKSESRLKEAVYLYFVNYFDLKKEKDELLKIFKKFDINNDGQISKNELIEIYSKFQNLENVENHVDSILDKFDYNQTKAINFSEFCVANLDLQKHLTEQKLKQIFSILDKNSTGFIDNQNLKQFFNLSEKYNEFVKEIINEVDITKNGKISFEEFKIMMNVL